MSDEAARTVADVRWAGASVLICFFLLNLLNYADRLLFGVVQELIRKDLGLSDFQLGVLGGPAFAVLYLAAAFPIARLAERRNRVRIIATCFTIWSALTALCGAAGSFAQMLLLRAGVSIGESGCAPASHSLISDFFPPERRTSAMSVFAAAGPAGALIAPIGGAALAQALGWRVTFLFAGAAGVLLAAFIAFTVREPRRTVDALPHTMRHVLATLLGQRSYLLAGLAGAVAGLASFSNYQFLVSFLMRAHGFTVAQAGLVLGLAIGATGIVMTLATGWLIDRGRRVFPTIATWLPAAGLLWSGIFFATAFSTRATAPAIALLVVGSMGQHFYVPALYTLAQDLAPPTMRATSAALITTMTACLGLALGPPLTGLFSDVFGSAAMAAAGVDPALCARAASAACTAAAAHGLRMSLLAVSSFWIVAALLYWLSGRAALAVRPLAGLATADA